MPMLETADGALYFEVTDLTPPWIAAPETILFHHGVGASADIFAGWLPALTGRYRIVRFDMRGCGRSVTPPDGFEWSLNGMIADVMAIADASDTAAFHLVGESVGGTIALAAAAQQPDRITTITGVSCAHKGMMIGQVTGWRDFIAERGMASWSAQMMQNRFYPDAVPDDQRTWFDARQSAADPEVVLGLADMLIATDLTDTLPTIGCPALLLAPDASPFVGPAIAAEIHGLLANSDLHVFAHTRHGLAFSHAAACAETLAGFLAGRQA